MHDTCVRKHVWTYVLNTCWLVTVGQHVLRRGGRKKETVQRENVPAIPSLVIVKKKVS